MKVYVVMGIIQYESGSVKGVFASKQHAEQMAEEINNTGSYQGERVYVDRAEVEEHEVVK